ncbi:MAG: DUF494 family protein [candidate division Zixibacteria bacterium]|nr:DUF494 family protein [candidate division Zixibacteria bacterium]
MVLGEKILEIVIYLVKRLEENGGRLDKINEMAEDLRSQGFTDNEINSAYMWVIDQYRQPGFIVHRSGNLNKTDFRRVLSEFERNFFTTEGYGALIQMRNLGLIDDTQLEMIIERAMLSGQNQLDADSVRTLAWSFMITNTPGDQSNLSLSVLDFGDNPQVH